jgi:hypothetical protein
MGGHTYTGPKPRPVPLSHKKPSEEQIALQHLIDSRGRDFVLAFFKSADVTEDDLARVSLGQTVDGAVFKRIQKVMRERLAEDVVKTAATPANCPTCGQPWK